jgi:hypothetical protein
MSIVRPSLWACYWKFRSRCKRAALMECSRPNLRRDMHWVARRSDRGRRHSRIGFTDADEIISAEGRQPPMVSLVCKACRKRNGSASPSTLGSTSAARRSINDRPPAIGVRASLNGTFGCHSRCCNAHCLQRSPHAKAVSCKDAYHSADGCGISLEQCPAPTGFENDTHSKSTALDDIEWYHRLAKLAELRDGGRCLRVPAANLKVKFLYHQLRRVAVILIFDTI